MPIEPLPTLDDLLARRNARRLDDRGDPTVAEGRRDLSLRLWESYTTFNALRRHLSEQRPKDPAKRGKQRFSMRNSAQVQLVAQLLDAGYITGGNGFYRQSDDPDTKGYLSGDWLEELGYLAILASGADEAYFSQKIEWRVGDLVGSNEIDVIARKGDILSFISCKTAKPIYSSKDERLRENFLHFLLEANYWDLHFGEGKGRAVLLVSTDLYNESLDRWRCPTLAARSTILDTDLIGNDHDSWETLVTALRHHWAE
jgi:hypothetical protein